MYKNKFKSINENSFVIRNNICGLMVRKIRKEKFPKWSQKDLADKLQLLGHDINKNAIQQLESGKRFVTDIELKALSQVLGVSIDFLLEEDNFYSDSDLRSEKDIAESSQLYTKEKK